MSINGRTMVPLRFVAENLGASVVWNSSTQEATIISNMDIVFLAGSS